MRAAVEINFVSSFEAEANWPKRRFETGRGVDCGIQVRGAQSQDRARDIAVREQGGSEAEIHETGFEGDEGTESSTFGLELGADQSVSYADRRVFDGGDISVGEIAVGLVEVDAVIIGKFGFEHDVMMHTVAKAAAESEIVGAGLRDVQVIDEHAEFDTRLGRERQDE